VTSIIGFLESKKITVPKHHILILEERWERIESLKKEIESALLDDYDIGVRNIPGGDHIE
jgi:DNA-directed RNA polymerase subunit H (RpoH/RPB5)